MPETLRAIIRPIPDFPKPGILFYDITPLLQDPITFARAIELLKERYQDQKPDRIVAVESRGFIFGAPLALQLGVGLVIVRKPGKLPYKRRSLTYELEYGSDSVEIHEDAIEAGDRVVIIDDLLATGGTAEATGKLVQALGAEIQEYAFVIELAALKGRARLEGSPIFSLLSYE